MAQKMLDIETAYGEKKCLNNYLKTKFGKRFFIISDSYSKYIGLFDFNFLAGGSIMTNSEAEKIKNLEIINASKGDILIAGLGIGLIILPIMSKQEVNCVDVVELHKEVIDLVAGQLPLNEKVKIINENICLFTPEKKYDFIYLDIIGIDHCTEEEIAKRTIGGKFIDEKQLSIIFQKHLKEKGEILIF